MTRALPLYVMAPVTLFDGTALAEGTLPNSKITQRIKEVMEPLWDNVGATLDFIYSVPGHPLMRPESGYIIFVSPPFSCLFFNQFPNPSRLTLKGARPAEGPYPHGSPSAAAEGFSCEGGESR